MKLLITAPYFQKVMDYYGPLFDTIGIDYEVPEVRERLSEDELLDLIEGIDGVISGDDKFTQRVFEKADRLKVISKWGTGIDSIDQDAAEEHGVAVRNTPGAFNEPVADQVWSYMLSFARQVPWINEFMKEGRWAKLPGHSLQGKTLGVVGIGNTGKEVVKRAAGFDMNLLGNDLVDIDADFCNQHHLKMVTLSELLRNADYISLNCDLNPTSHHLITAAQLAQMKPSAVLINCARGPLIKHDDLITALEDGIIGGAALDVFEVEPLPSDDPLRSLENVLMSPHNANSSPEHWERVHRNTVRNALDLLGVDTSKIIWPNTIS